MPRAHRDPIVPSGLDPKKTCGLCYYYKDWHPKPNEVTEKMKEEGIPAHKFILKKPTRGLVHVSFPVGVRWSKIPLCLDVEWDPSYVGIVTVGPKAEDMINCPRCIEKRLNAEFTILPSFKVRRWFKIEGSEGKRRIRAFSRRDPPIRKKRT